MAFEDQTIEDVDRRRLWTRVRTVATLLVLIGVVVGAASYSWRNVMGNEDGDVASTTTMPCAPGVPTTAPAPAEIQVNVYNATDRSGLASAIAKQMRDRGFVVVDVDNDPLNKKVEGTAEVRAHSDHWAAAGLVASLVPDAAYLPDDRSDQVVDLVLGDAFEALVNPDAPAPTPSSDLPACQPTAESG